MLVPSVNIFVTDCPLYMVCVPLQGHHGPFGVEVEQSQQNCTVPVHEADTPNIQLLGVGIMVMVWAIAK
jgi:hypothetical protein